MGQGTSRKEVRIVFNNIFPFGMLAAGVILIIAASVECDEEIGDGACEGDGELLALVLAVINTVLALIYVLLIHRRELSSQWDFIYSIVLFGLWVTTAAFLTFDAPFPIPDNGYMASWLGAFAAMGNLALVEEFARLLGSRIEKQTLPLFLMIGGSVVLLGDLLYGNDDCCEDDEIVALVASIVGIVVGFVRIIAGKGCDFWISLFLAIFWLVCGSIITFRLFTVVGNGYLGTWVAMISSFALLAQAE